MNNVAKTGLKLFILELSSRTVHKRLKYHINNVPKNYFPLKVLKNIKVGSLTFLWKINWFTLYYITLQTIGDANYLGELSI